MVKMFELVPEQEYPALAQLIAQLWHSAYDGLLGVRQVEYMTQKFQSAEAICRQVQEQNYLYFYLKKGGKTIGYCGIRAEEDRLFFFFFYLRKEEWGKGNGRRALQTVAEMAKRLGLASVYLTVNKQNARAIRVYERFGFVRTDSEVTDIGGGFVMDDYIYEYSL